MNSAAITVMIVLVLIAALAAAVLFSWIRFELSTTRVKEHDRFTLDIKALYGLFRYSVYIPIINFRNWSDGIMFKQKTDTSAKVLASGPKEVHLTRERIMDFYERARLLIKNVFNLFGWMKDTLARVECTHFVWHTRVGIGDAPETAFTTGLIWSVKSSLLAFVFNRICLKTHPDVQVAPQYNKQVFSMELHWKAQIRVGHVLMAGIRLVPHIWMGNRDWKSWQQILFRPRLKGTG